MKYPDGRWPCEAEGIYGGGVVRSQNLIYDEACHFMGGAVYMYMDILALVAALPPPEWQSRRVWLMESSPETSTTYP